MLMGLVSVEVIGREIVLMQMVWLQPAVVCGTNKSDSAVAEVTF